jgi:bacteriochlorophyll 4-vinyl reductase
MRITGNPLCRGLVAEVPVCGFDAAPFQRLFAALVHPRTQVTEVACKV